MRCELFCGSRDYHLIDTGLKTKWTWVDYIFKIVYSQFTGVQWGPAPFVAWQMSYLYSSSVNTLPSKSGVSEVIDLVSCLLQQLISVIFKSQTFLLNFMHCWGWYSQLLENISDWFAWTALAASSWPSGNYHSMGLYLFQYNLSLYRQIISFINCVSMVASSLMLLKNFIYAIITNFMKLQHPLFRFCLRCHFQYCLLSSNEEKARQLLRPACIYCSSWKHGHDFWTLTVAVVTLCISEH
jgi:hypothetical protein